MDGQLVRKLIVENLDSIIRCEDLRQLPVERWDIMNELAIILVAGIPAGEVFVERLLKNIQFRVSLENLIKTGTPTAWMREEDDPKIWVHLIKLPCHREDASRETPGVTARNHSISLLCQRTDVIQI